MQQQCSRRWKRSLKKHSKAVNQMQIIRQNLDEGMSKMGDLLSESPLLTLERRNPGRAPISERQFAFLSIHPLFYPSALLLPSSSLDRIREQSRESPSSW